MVKIDLWPNVYRVMMSVKSAGEVAEADFPYGGCVCPYCCRRLKALNYKARYSCEVESCSLIYCDCGKYAIRTAMQQEAIIP